MRSEAPTEDVDKAAALFFQRLNAAEYDAIYDDSAKHFKEQNTRPAVVDNLKQITAIGKPRQHARLSMTFEQEGDNRIALPVYGVFLDATSAEITLKFVDDRGEWKLLGFAVKPHTT
ncbi:MAG TPA: hypothetical protein VNO70_09405 [Blastocatellia bacterium]|nr:hypothetical protein [Blastocatellia bacterium]